MPIAAGLPILQSQFMLALSMKQGAQVQLTSNLLASAVGTIAPMGLLPIPPTFIPLIPAGLSAGLAMIQQALSMKQGAQISTVSQLIATGISLIAPLAPPAGMSALTKQIESALSMKQGAKVQTTANLLASAVISYYSCGGII